MSEYAIGLDLGGGSVRALVLDLETGATTSAAVPLAPAAAPGTGGLGFDLDPEACSAALARATRQALAASGARAAQVRGIACAGMRLGTVVLDEAGAPLLAVPNRDARAARPGLVLAAQHGDALLRASGHWPGPIYTAARLCWLRETRPESLERARHVLSLSDWMGFLLCGEAASDPSQAAESLLYDLGSAGWSWEWIDRLEIPRRLFPEIRPSGSPLGSLTGAAAEAFGLAPGTAVYVGGADTQCGLLGTGAVTPGDVGIVAGTTAPVQVVVDRPVIDTDARLWTGRHVVPERWVVESNAGPVGDALDWTARVLYPDAPAATGATAMLLGEAAASPPGAHGLLSSVGVQLMNARDSRLPVGRLSLCHMTSSRDPAPRRHVARAVVEGIACGLRANLEQARAIARQGSAGAGTGARLGGGLTRSAFFARVLADVLGEPVLVSPQPEATALGAALCAAAGIGGGALAETAAARTTGVRRVDPDPATADASQDVYARWSQLHAEERSADAAAARMTMPFALAAWSAGTHGGGARFRPRILVTSDCDETSLAALRELGEVEYASFREAGRMLKGKALVAALQGVNVFVTEIDLVDAAALEQLPELRVVVSCRGDAVNVDADACTAFGVPMLRTPGRNADAVADLTLGFLLMLARKLPEATAFLHEPGAAAGDLARMGQAFVRFRGRELWNKTVGLVGLGAVGAKVAARLRPFGARVLVADPYVSPERAAAAGASAVPLETLLRESDFVSLHAAVTPETRGMLGAAQIAAMKPGACLVNTARAALLDEDALAAALTEGRLGGAALDTFAVEPPGSDHPLLTLSNVIATPHVGGNTAEVAAHQGEIVVAELTALLAGERPRFAVNPEVLDGFDWRGPRPTPDADVLARLKQGPAPAVSDLQKQKQDRERKHQKKEPAAPR